MNMNNDMNEEKKEGNNLAKENTQTDSNNDNLLDGYGNSDGYDIANNNSEENEEEKEDEDESHSTCNDDELENEEEEEEEEALEEEEEEDNDETADPKKQDYKVRLHQIVLSLPESPGVYQYFDKTGTIIYVGKAVNLKRRVSSYFNKNHQNSLKTRILVTKIRALKYIVVPTEQDALLLENALIKKHQPKYNILLKDGKTYPWIVVKNEPYPRVFQTRQYIHDGSTYFGPYTYISAMRVVLETIHNIYRLRTCGYNLSPENIYNDKYRVCLKYHIHKCNGCCEGKQKLADYNQNIEEIKLILKGELDQLIDVLTKNMMAEADKLNFEEAQKIKEKIEMLGNYRSKSTIVNPSIHNVDVFSIETDDNVAFVNYLKVVRGTINQAYTFEYKIHAQEEPREILASAIIEMRERFKSESREIILPFEIEYQIANTTVTIPQRGDKKKLLDLSVQNVKQYRFDRLKQMEKFNPEQRAVKLLAEIQKELHMKDLPRRIECFDNSNISGTDAVAACVVFDMGKPNKKEYRKYNIQTVEGPDDYASMKEVVRRRYTRLKEEGGTMPDLIIADGGAGQMEVIREVVEDELHLSLNIAGLAKDDRHRTKELLFGFPPAVIGMNPDSQVFRLLAKIQDEVHRFAITFHRDKRSKRQIHSVLDDIAGIGEVTKKTLMNKFKSVKRIKEATHEQLAEVVGTAKAKILLNYFGPADGEKDTSDDNRTAEGHAPQA